MDTSSHRLNLFADYFQLIVTDTGPTAESPDSWSEEAMAQMLLTSRTAAHLGTLRNITVPVVVHCASERPVLDLSAYDHAVTASLETPSGEVAIMGCTDSLDDARRFPINTTSLQLLYLVSGASSVTDESGPADDLYEIYLWPGPKVGVELLKSLRHVA
jgi:hypothetical protein